MSLTKKKLTLTKKTLFLYKKRANPDPPTVISDPTMTTGGSSNWP